MARRVRFSIAQPITISGFYVASVLLIALIAVASHHLHAPGVQDQGLTQAFYYAIFAAGLYFIIASLMCITVYGAYAGHYSKEFKLTVSQRTLMLQTISFMVYLLLGALIYRKIEGWKFLDAVYWADFTCLTIGIGDFAPATHLGRSLMFPYAIGGIVILGLVVGSIRSLVLDRGKKKMSARMTEKTRKAVLRRIKTQEDSQTGRTTITHSRKFGFGGATTFSLHPIESNSSNSSRGNDPKKDSARHLERQRRMAEFHAMRYVQSLAAVERKWFSLLISGSAWFILWFVGALVFSRAEQTQQWSYFSGLYFAYTSLLTIGYGDLTPFSNSTKAFFVFWSLLAVPTLTILISNMGDTVVKAVKEITLYLGELTFLPAEKEDLSYWDRVSYGVRKLSGGYIDLSTKHLKLATAASKRRKKKSLLQIVADQDRESPPDVEEPGMRPIEPAKSSDPESHFVCDGGSEEPANKTSSTVPATSQTPSDPNDRSHIPHPTSHSHFLLLLVQEIKTAYAHLQASPPKNYTYEEWERFLHLIGEDEADAEFHRAPPVKVKKQRHSRVTSTASGGSGSGSLTGSGADDNDNRDEEDEDKGERKREVEVDALPETSRAITIAVPAAEEDEGEKGKEKERRKEKQKWSWMGNRSPLMGEKDEAEWVVERLMEVLERELRGLHNRRKGAGGGSGSERKARSGGKERRWGG